MAQDKATMARPYANAVLAVAKADGRLDEWSSMLRVLAGAAATPRVQQLLASPTIGGAEKVEALAGVCGDALDDKGRRFLEVLADNKRWQFFDEISRQYETLRAEEQRALDVDLVSAYELSENETKALVDSLRRRFSREIRLTSRVDSTLLGGVVIRAGDTVIDGSVRGRLNRLSESLQLA